MKLVVAIAVVALVAGVVLACRRKVEVAMPTGPISSWKVPEKWSIGQVTQDGKPIFTRFNVALKPYAGRPEFSHQLGIAVPLKNPTPDGLPTPAEAEQLNQIEDEIGRLFLVGNESLFAGVITTNGMREFVLYTSNPTAATAKAADLARKVHHHEIQFVMNDDPEWKVFSHFGPGA